MNKKILYGILIGFGVLVLLLLTFPFGALISLAFWIYVGVKFRKNKHAFHKEIDAVLMKKLLKRLKILAIAAAITFVIAIVGIIMHNIRSGLLEMEEVFWFFVGLISLYLFILSSAAGFFVIIRGRRKST